jgi:predicted acetyltransferase
VLKALMTHQLNAVHERGREALAILWASEPPIYGRFGYGQASRALSLTVPRNPQALHPSAPSDPGLRLRLVDAADWKLTAGVYADVAGQRPGLPARDDRWWGHAVQDLPSVREGRSALRCVVVEDDAGVRGYARYSTKDVFGEGPNSGKVMVREVMAVDAAAQATLYRYLFDLDLMGTTHLWNVPVDDPLLHWLQNPRLAKPELGDALYVRLVDLDRALRERTYSAPVDVVLEVADDVCPWNAGRWRLTGGPGLAATCERTEDPADLAVGVVDLGAVYLGGTSLTDLSVAGRVVELRPGTLAAATAAFAHTPAPWCPAVF